MFNLTNAIKNTPKKLPLKTISYIPNPIYDIISYNMRNIDLFHLQINLQILKKYQRSKFNPIQQYKDNL
jgi:hypothetical protein